MKLTNEYLSTHRSLGPTSRGLLAIGLIANLILPAQAVVKTWDGSSSGNWTTAANWTGGVAPANGDDLVFPGGAAHLINTNNYTNLKVNSITFTGSGYSLRGNALTVTNGISGQQAGGANAVECAVTLGAAQTFDCVTAGASQFLFGNITNAGRLLTLSGSGSLNLGGSISGTGGITKNGTGPLIFSGATANTYSGATLVNSGIVLLEKSISNGSVVGSTLTVGDGVGTMNSAVVRLYSAPQIATTPDITINADGLLDLNDITEAIGNSLRDSPLSRPFFS